jgi:hypothetical protein
MQGKGLSWTKLLHVECHGFEVAVIPSPSPGSFPARVCPSNLETAGLLRNSSWRGSRRASEKQQLDLLGSLVEDLPCSCSDLLIPACVGEVKEIWVFRS